ncbi:hypothetical protein J2T10_000761 [Paenarthrobacter nicotinovorans]|uniref:Uncharacterized protein n=1 Tax=Paenarthrobacter nicotinovorans TaxID=29320 RepID=A0ABT9TKV1_PAENI|nr:hypothetical protein [Paenarthrobacter nicotinovorans]MDQ0101142.1 hypothetical protein [Paenarthrobacter nicotinovorans]
MTAPADLPAFLLGSDFGPRLVDLEELTKIQTTDKDKDDDQ